MIGSFLFYKIEKNNHTFDTSLNDKLSFAQFFRTFIFIHDTYWKYYECTCNLI
jgi:hypothetical protein